MIENISDAAMLEGLAEEAAELAQAALKLARVIRDENPTPVTAEEAEWHLSEEMVDVLLYLQEIRDRWGITLAEINNIMILKRQRWENRMDGRSNGQGNDRDE